MSLRAQMALRAALLLAGGLFILAAVLIWSGYRAAAPAPVDSLTLVRALVSTAVLAGVILLLAGATATYLAAQTASRPVDEIDQAIAAIAAENYQAGALTDLIARRDELGRLSRSVEQMARQVADRDRRLRLLRTVIPVGVRLSAERDFNRLLETILLEAQELTNADAGTLYLVTETQTLRFVIVRNTSLKIAMGGTTGTPITFPDVPLYDEDGKPNHRNVASHAALTAERVTIPDAYQAEGFDFSGTRAFDARTGYRSQSFLTIPLEGESGKVAGVIQLLNAKDRVTGDVVPFEVDDVIDSLVLLASSALRGYIREEALRKEIDKLRIEIDRTKQAQQVQEITDTQYFQTLQQRARQIRERRSKKE